MSITSSFKKDLLRKLPFKPGNMKQLYRSKNKSYCTKACSKELIQHNLFQGLAKVETEKGLPISLMSSQKDIYQRIIKALWFIQQPKLQI